jgi:serine/threonine-protein kinase RsbW
VDARVSLVVPASPDYIPVVRLVVTGAAAILDVPYDTVEDIRLAITESCNRLLSLAVPAGDLRLTLDPGPEGLRVAVSIDADVDEWPPPEDGESLAWTILSVLADDAREELIDGAPSIVTTWRSIGAPAE